MVDIEQFCQVEFGSTYKNGSGDERMYRCPFGRHEDHKESCAVNPVKRVYKCFACGEAGSFFELAKSKMYEKPHLYIPNGNGYMNGDGGGSVADPHSGINSSVASPPKTSKPPVPAPDLEKLMEQYKTNFKNNMEKFPHHTWLGEELLIDEMDIGLDSKNNLQFGHHGWNGKLVAIRSHKSRVVGDGKSKWYLPHLIAKHKHEKDLFITEGEQDALCLVSRDMQATTGTTGCQSIPKNADGYYDLEWLQYYTGWIYICYDNDEPGRKGAEKLANAIIEKYPSHKVAIIQWDKSLPVGWDIFDSYEKHPSGQEFQDAVLNAKEIKPVVPERFGGLKFKSGVDAMKSDAQPTFELIESLLPQNQQILIAGTMKANKSMMCMQMGMAMANNESKFLEFDINARDIEILYVDSENGEKIFDYRLQMLATTFNDFANNGAKRFNYITKDKREPDMMMRIEDAVKYFRPDVLFVDCLYNCTGGIDMGKDYSLTPVLDSITEMKQKYNLTIPAIHHLNKGLHELGLISDRMRGASNLLFWMEHSVLMCRTNDPFLRLLKFGETRSIGVPDCYYGLEFNPKDYSLTSKGIVEDWEQYLITSKKKKNYEYYLSFMDDEFTTDDWHKKTWDDEVPASTSEKWLYHMEKCKLIESAGYGNWKKKLKVI